MLTTMKSILAVVAALAVVPLAGAVRQDEVDASEIIQRALKRYGGKENFRQLDTCRTRIRGSYFLGKGKTLAFESEVLAESKSNRYRQDLRMTIEGRSRLLVRTLDGQVGWQKFGDDITDITGDDLKDFRG